MQIYVHTDNNIDGGSELTARVELEIETALSRFGDRFTRIDAHLSDESAGRPTGADIRCLIEARRTGRAPVTATDDADTMDRALNGAVHKLSRLLDSDDGQQNDDGRRTSIRGHSDR